MSRRTPGRRRGGPSPARVVGLESRGHSSLCTHDRICYPSRAAAHARALQVRKEDPAGQRLRPYRCTDVDGAWHLGVLPDAVIAGEATADEYYTPQPEGAPMSDPEPEPVAAGNTDPFAGHAGLPVRAAIADVELWRLRAVHLGVVAPTTDAEHAAIEPGRPLPPGVADDELTRAMVLQLIDASADPRDGDEPVNLCIAFELPELEMLIGEVGAALKPRVRFAVGMALIESSRRSQR